tara:strand:+ start:609 stop:878 length:270 start_codon:yes stop_codon:yes gene_type:complete
VISRKRSFKIESKAIRYLEKLDAKKYKKVLQFTFGLTKDSTKDDNNIKPLSGRPGEWRYRFGDYRAIYKITDTEVRLTDVFPRGDNYKL